MNARLVVAVAIALGAGAGVGERAEAAVVPMPADPVALAADPARAVFFATTATTLIEIDAASASISRTLDIAGGPLGVMAADPAGSRLFVALRGARAVAVVDAPTLSVLTTVPTGAARTGPGGLALRGSRLYASFDDGLSIIDTGALAEAAFHPLRFGTYADSSLALSADGRVLYSMQSGWSPSSIYAHDVTGDGLVAAGEECCHGCVNFTYPGLMVSALTGRLLVGQDGIASFSSRPLYHVEGVLPVGGAPRGIAQSADGRLLAATVSLGLVLCDATTGLPWRREWLQGSPGDVALSADGATAAVVIDSAGPGMSVELVRIAGLAPDVGGIRLRAIDAYSGISFSPYTQLTPQSGERTRIDEEAGTIAIGLLAPGSYTLDVGPSLSDTRSIAVTVTAGRWTGLGDLAFDLLAPPVMSTIGTCVSPPVVRGTRQVTQVHVRNVRPGCTVEFTDPAITVHGSAYRSWSVMDVDLTAPAGLREGLAGSVRVTDTGGTVTMGSYWIEDALRSDVTPPAPVRGLRVDRDPGAVFMSWEPVTTDVLGAPETIVRYEVLRADAPTAFNGTTWMSAPGTALAVADAPTDPALTCWLVRAVDAAGLVGSER